MTERGSLRGCASPSVKFDAKTLPFEIEMDEAATLLLFWALLLLLRCGWIEFRLDAIIDASDAIGLVVHGRELRAARPVAGPVVPVVVELPVSRDKFSIRMSMNGMYNAAIRPCLSFLFFYFLNIKKSKLIKTN